MKIDLLDFIKDEQQYIFRKCCQLKTDRFEHTLQKYKCLFIDEYLQCCNNSKAKKNNINTELIKYLLEIPQQNIEVFFNTLNNVYLKWINSEANESVQLLRNLLKDYKILDNIEISNLILYRGRISSSFISHWDMFHIPFNRRHLINNQRYSLVGQPLLYLASSPYCVFKELNSPEDLKISSFRFNYNVSFKFFNNTNELIDLIVTQQDSPIDINNYVPKEISKDKVVSAFYKLILASCCSFKRDLNGLNYSFKEEYILPQILAQVLKSEQYDGIIYTSTQLYDDTNYNNYSKKYIPELYKNYCFFTKYDFKNAFDPTYVYDKELYRKFIISSPIDSVLNIKECYYSIEDSIDYIERITNRLRMSSTYASNTFLLDNISSTLDSYTELYSNNDHKLNNVFTQFKNLHSLFLRNIIVNIYENLLFKEDQKCRKIY